MIKMRLSEAIRLGSMLHPQAFGIRHAEDGSSCVLGAVEDACGIEPYALMSHSGHFPILNLVVENPVTGKLDSLDVVIAGLNNCGGDYCLDTFLCRIVIDRKKSWTRERIADWLETIEPELEARLSTRQETSPALPELVEA